MTILKLTIMATVIITSILLSANQDLNAIDESIHVNGLPKSAVIYRNGATIETSFKVNLKEGKNLILVDSISNSCINSTIRIGSDVPISIIDTKFIQEQKVVVKPDSIKVKFWQDSMAVINDRKTWVATELRVIDQNLQIIKSINTGNMLQFEKSADVLPKIYEFQENKVLNLERNKFNLTNEMNKLVQYYNFAQQKLNELTTSTLIQNFQILIEVYTEKQTTATMDVSYFINSANWLPEYELRADGIKSKPVLIYKAKVVQSSYKNWNDVSLTLSTRDPNVSGNIPVMNPWYMNIEMPRSAQTDDLSSPLSPGSVSNVRTFDIDKSRVKMKMELGGAEINLGTLENKYMNAEFKPKLKYDLANGISKSITINQLELDAEFDYYALPKLTPNAYLVAKLKDWEELRLLPGNAYVYFENSYIGTTNIDPFQNKDEMVISFGIDKGLMIERIEDKKFTEEKFLSSNNIRYFGYITKVKNMRDRDIEITIEDQVPVPLHEDIEVEILESSDAKFEKSTGKLTWVLKIPAKESKEIKFSFKIDAPESVKIR